MDVEDRYGDLQSLYWNATDGDLLLNKSNSRIAIVALKKNRIYVKEGTRLIDVEEWLDPKNKRKFEAAIYRPEQAMNSTGYVDRKDLDSTCKLIIEISVVD